MTGFGNVHINMRNHPMMLDNPRCYEIMFPFVRFKIISSM